MAFDDLSLHLFVAGELEIITDCNTKSKEKKGRLKLLKRLMYLSTNYSFSIIRSYYAAVLREIEVGEKSWADEFLYLENEILNQSIVMKPGGYKFKGRFQPKAKQDDVKDESSVWFCSA